MLAASGSFIVNYTHSHTLLHTHTHTHSVGMNKQHNDDFYGVSAMFSLHLSHMHLIEQNVSILISTDVCINNWVSFTLYLWNCNQKSILLHSTCGTLKLWTLLKHGQQPILNTLSNVPECIACVTLMENRTWTCCCCWAVNVLLPVEGNSLGP